MSDPVVARDSRLAAGLLAACAGLGLLALLHHPTGFAHAAPGAPMPSVGALVHGAMLAIVALLVAGLGQYAATRGAHGFWPRTGFLMFAAAALAAGGAALINGFIAPDVHAQAGGAAGEALRIGLWAANQRLMAVAGLGFAAAVAAWGIDLLRTPGARTAGGFAVALAIVEVVAQFAHGHRFDVVAMQWFWAWLCAAVAPFAWRLWHGRD